MAQRASDPDDPDDVAAGWGGLPSSESSYVGVQTDVPPGDYELVLRDAPVDAFWSVSVYDAKGVFAPNPLGRAPSQRGEASSRTARSPIC